MSALGRRTSGGALLSSASCLQRKKSRIAPRPFSSNLHRPSVAVDSDAHAGHAEADAATLLIATPLDVTLARRISVIIASVADDDAAFAAFAPATTDFIADHA